MKLENQKLATMLNTHPHTYILDLEFTSSFLGQLSLNIFLVYKEAGTGTELHTIIHTFLFPRLMGKRTGAAFSFNILSGRYYVISSPILPYLV